MYKNTIFVNVTKNLWFIKNFNNLNFPTGNSPALDTTYSKVAIAVRTLIFYRFQRTKFNLIWPLEELKINQHISFNT